MRLPRLLIEAEHLWPAGEWRALAGTRQGAAGAARVPPRGGACAPPGRAPLPSHICPAHHPPTWASAGPTVQAVPAALPPVVAGCLWGRSALPRSGSCRAVCRQKGAPCGAAEPRTARRSVPAVSSRSAAGWVPVPGGRGPGEHWHWEGKFCGLMNTFFHLFSARSLQETVRNAVLST